MARLAQWMFAVNSLCLAWTSLASAGNLSPNPTPEASTAVPSSPGFTEQSVESAPVAAASSNSTADVVNVTIPDENAKVLSHLLYLLDKLNHVPYLEELAREPAQAQDQIPAIQEAMQELKGGMQDNATLRVTLYASPEEGGDALPTMQKEFVLVRPSNGSRDLVPAEGNVYGHVSPSAYRDSNADQESQGYRYGKWASGARAKYHEQHGLQNADGGHHHDEKAKSTSHKERGHDRAGQAERKYRVRTEIEYFEREKFKDDEHDKLKAAHHSRSSTDAVKTAEKFASQGHDAHQNQYGGHSQDSHQVVGSGYIPHYSHGVLQPQGSEKGLEGDSSGFSQKDARNHEEYHHQAGSRGFTDKDKGHQRAGWRERGYRIVAEKEYVDKDKHHDKAYGVDNQEQGHRVHSKEHHAHEEGHDDVEKAKEHYQKGIHDSAHQERLHKKNKGGYHQDYAIVGSSHPRGAGDYVSSSTDEVSALKTGNVTNNLPRNADKKRNIVRIRVRTKDQLVPTVTVGHMDGALIGSVIGESGSYARTPHANIVTEKHKPFSEQDRGSERDERGGDRSYGSVPFSEAQQTRPQDPRQHLAVSRPAESAGGSDQYSGQYYNTKEGEIIHNRPYSARDYGTTEYDPQSNHGAGPYLVNANENSAHNPQPYSTVTSNPLAQPDTPVGNTPYSPRHYIPGAVLGGINQNNQYIAGAYSATVQDAAAVNNNNQYNRGVYPVSQYTEAAQHPPHSSQSPQLGAIETARAPYNTGSQVPRGQEDTRSNDGTLYDSLPPLKRNEQNSANGFLYRHPVEQPHSGQLTPQHALTHNAYTYSPEVQHGVSNQQKGITTNPQIIAYPLYVDGRPLTEEEYRAQFSRTTGPETYASQQNLPNNAFVRDDGVASPYAGYAYIPGEQSVQHVVQADEGSKASNKHIFETFRGREGVSFRGPVKPKENQGLPRNEGSRDSYANEKLSSGRGFTSIDFKGTVPLSRTAKLERGGPCLKGNCTGVQSVPTENALSYEKSEILQNYSKERDIPYKKCAKGKCLTAARGDGYLECDNKRGNTRCARTIQNGKKQRLTNLPNRRAMEKHIYRSTSSPNGRRFTDNPSKPKTMEEQAAMAADAELDLARPMLEGMGYVFDMQGSASVTSKVHASGRPDVRFSQPLVMQSSETVGNSGLWRAKTSAS